MEQKSIIFHHPLPISTRGYSGSQVRPHRMLTAFQQLGFEVEQVAGYARERKRAADRVQQQIREGRGFAFAYSESSTMPAALTEPHHLPLRPFLDGGFFRLLRRNGVPLGLFYRDIHWRFPSYQQRVSWYKRAIAIRFYEWEWEQYRRWVDHLFLPSLAMREVLPGQWPADRVSALAPGCNAADVDRPVTRAGDLDLFYVGGVTPPTYDLRSMIACVRAVPGVRLTLCCRRDEWSRVSDYYQPALHDRMKLVHAPSDALADHYSAASAFLLFWEPSEYLDFAVPVKLLEALGYGLPIITSAGTESARFVEQESIGWVVSRQSELEELLLQLRDNPASLAAMQVRTRSVQERHTWLARAQTVADLLTSAVSGSAPVSVRGKAIVAEAERFTP